MFKSVNCWDYFMWKVFDIDKNKFIQGVQWANDKTGELERILFNHKNEPILVYKSDCPLIAELYTVKEKRNIRLIKIKEKK